MIEEKKLKALIARMLNVSKPKESSLPIGVTYIPRIDRYMSKCRYLNLETGESLQKTLGYYPSASDAFNAYRLFKEDSIKQFAIAYKKEIISLYGIEEYDKLINFSVTWESTIESN